MHITTTFRRKLDKPDFVRMNLPEAFWRVRVQGVSQDCQAHVTRYLSKIHDMVSMGAGLILFGEEGRGKTGIAALIAKEARSFGYTAYFTTVWEMREMIRSRINYTDEQSVMSRAREVDVLVLDDLRMEDIDQGWFGRSEIEALVSDRVARRRITLITTRMSAAEIQGKLKSLMSVSKDGLVPFPVRGEDKRAVTQRELQAAIFGK